MIRKMKNKFTIFVLLGWGLLFSLFLLIPLGLSANPPMNRLLLYAMTSR